MSDVRETVKVASIQQLTELWRLAKDPARLSEDARVWLKGPVLFGWRPNGILGAEFAGDDFRIANGWDQACRGIYETSGLRYNEAYAEFLLELEWEDPLGWKSPLHALAITQLDARDEVRHG